MRYSAQERRETNHQHQNFLAILVTAEKKVIVESCHMHSWAALSPHLLMLWQPSLMEVRITSTVANWLSTPRKRTRQKNTADQSWGPIRAQYGGGGWLSANHSSPGGRASGRGRGGRRRRRGRARPPPPRPRAAPIRGEHGAGLTNGSSPGPAGARGCRGRRTRRCRT